MKRRRITSPRSATLFTSRSAMLRRWSRRQCRFPPIPKPEQPSRRRSRRLGNDRCSPVKTAAAPTSRLRCRRSPRTPPGRCRSRRSRPPQSSTHRKTRRRRPRRRSAGAAARRRRSLRLPWPIRLPPTRTCLPIRSSQPQASRRPGRCCRRAAAAGPSAAATRSTPASRCRSTSRTPTSKTSCAPSSSSPVSTSPSTLRSPARSPSISSMCRGTRRSRSSSARTASRTCSRGTSCASARRRDWPMRRRPTAAWPKQKRLNVPLQTVGFKLSYARATDVSALLKEMASPRARIIVDAADEPAHHQRDPDYLQTMRNLIESVDVPTRQVVIEARIVETTKVFIQQYGFNWGFRGDDGSVARDGHGAGLPQPRRHRRRSVRVRAGQPGDLVLSAERAGDI